MRGIQCDDRLTTHAHSFDPAHPHTVGFFVFASLRRAPHPGRSAPRTSAMNRIAQYLIDTPPPPPVVHRWAYDYSVPGVRSDFIPQNVAPSEVAAEAWPKATLPGG